MAVTFSLTVLNTTLVALCVILNTPHLSKSRCVTGASSLSFFLLPAAGSTAIQLKFYFCCLASVCCWGPDTLKKFAHYPCFLCRCSSRCCSDLLLPLLSKVTQISRGGNSLNCLRAPLSASCLFDKVATCQHSPARPLRLEKKEGGRPNCGF